MRVSVLAHTELRDDVMHEAYGYYVSDDATNPSDADALAEAAGRLCYKSFNRPNPATATNAGYLANIIDHGHFSVLEHASVTLLVRGISRALLAEITRHRHLSFSVVSQRYVDYGATQPVIPPAVREAGLAHLVWESYEEAEASYLTLVDRLTEAGYKRKQAREAARAVLPNAAPVDLVVTGNLRSWRDVLGKRHSKHADAEAQVFAHKVLARLREIAPNSVSDIPDEPED